MATDTWIGPNDDKTGANPGSGDFETGADWSTGSEPGTYDTAVLANATSADAYTVTSSSGVFIDSLTVGVNATLAIGGGSGSDLQYFQVNGGTVTNDGTISITTIDNYEVFSHGSFSNNGIVSNDYGGGILLYI